eukprot:13087644-Alexandrium_andersonii.AAC.1
MWPNGPTNAFATNSKWHPHFVFDALFQGGCASSCAVVLGMHEVVRDFQVEAAQRWPQAEARILAYVDNLVRQCDPACFA